MLALQEIITGISTILRKATVHRDTMSLEVLAEQQLATTTVEAFTAEFGIIRTDSVSEFEAFHALSHACNDTDGLMAGDEGEFGEKLALVDVEVRAADAAGFDFDEHVVVAEFGEVDFDDSVVFWFGVAVGKGGSLDRLNGVHQAFEGGG